MGGHFQRFLFLKDYIKNIYNLITGTTTKKANKSGQRNKIIKMTADSVWSNDDYNLLNVTSNDTDVISLQRHSPATSNCFNLF